MPGYSGRYSEPQPSPDRHKRLCVRPLVCRLSLGTRRYGETAVKHRAITESSWKKVINNRAIPFQLGMSKWVGPVGPQEKENDARAT